MDSLTQASLGAAIGEAVLGRHLGNRALIWGAIFGTLPDLDVIASPFLETAGRLEFHRGASHSILILLLATFLLAKPLAKLWKAEKISPTRAAVFVFLAWSTHVLIDCFTVYGTSVFWPFSPYRAALNNLFIIDPLYTLPLLIAIVWLAFKNYKTQTKRRTNILIWGLGISSLYVTFSFAMKSIASSAFATDLLARDITYIRRMEAPTPLNSLLWRAVVDKGDEFWIGYYSVLDPLLSDNPARPIQWTVYPRSRETLYPLRNIPEVQTLTWFSRGWWIARPHSQGTWIADVRFGEGRTYDSRPGFVDSRFLFSWNYLPDSVLDPLSSNPPAIRSPGDTLRRLASRIVGNTDQWEEKPRLAGVPGTLPEFLRVID